MIQDIIKQEILKYVKMCNVPAADASITINKYLRDLQNRQHVSGYSCMVISSTSAGGGTLQVSFTLPGDTRTHTQMYVVSAPGRTPSPKSVSTVSTGTTSRPIKTHKPSSKDEAEEAYDRAMSIF